MYPELHAEAEEKGLTSPQVDFVDVGCGFGGLTVRLAEAYPDKLVAGMEIRAKVSGESDWSGREDNQLRLLTMHQFFSPQSSIKLFNTKFLPPPPLPPPPPQSTCGSASWRCGSGSLGGTATPPASAPTP